MPGTPPVSPHAPRPPEPVLVRPVALPDLPDLLHLASLAGAGLTTLPDDEAVLRQRIRKSVECFARFPDSPGGESYLLVMQTLPASGTARVIGTAGIVAKVGGFEPFYSYLIENVRFESKHIGVRRDVPILRLHEQHDGPCEIGSLFLHPDYRYAYNGRFLQRVRFLLMAEHPSAFESTVVSEIRGVCDDAGRSPFWDALGRHFFGIDFCTADRLSVTNKKFIADLMPDHPIYIPLLPQDAQDVIGKPHPHSAPAVKNLVAEGFTYQNAVDIFDAGPVYACPRDQIRSVRHSRRGLVAEIVRDCPGELFMMATPAPDFRATKGTLQETPAGLRVSADAAHVLQLRLGQPLRYVELTPPVNASTDR